MRPKVIRLEDFIYPSEDDLYHSQPIIPLSPKVSVQYPKEKFLIQINAPIFLNVSQGFGENDVKKNFCSLTWSLKKICKTSPSTLYNMSVLPNTIIQQCFTFLLVAKRKKLIGMGKLDKNIINIILNKIVECQIDILSFSQKIGINCTNFNPKIRNLINFGDWLNKIKIGNKPKKTVMYLKEYDNIYNFTLPVNFKERNTVMFDSQKRQFPFPKTGIYKGKFIITFGSAWFTDFNCGIKLNLVQAMIKNNSRNRINLDFLSKLI
jgi:hypothetical protein